MKKTNGSRELTKFELRIGYLPSCRLKEFDRFQYQFFWNTDYSGFQAARRPTTTELEEISSGN